VLPAALIPALRRVPVSPNGVHQWLASAVHRTYAWLDASEQEKVLRWAIRDCGRAPQPNEIERTVENIRRKRGNGEASGHYYKPWPSPVPEAIQYRRAGRENKLTSEVLEQSIGWWLCLMPPEPL